MTLPQILKRMTQALKSLFASLKLNHDYKEVFASPQGQRVLADIMKRAGATRPQFDADPEKARFLEGHRHLAHSIFRMVHSSDEPLLKLISEEQNKQDHVTHYN